MQGQLPRRTFLGGAVGAAASALLLTGCHDESPATPASTSPAPPSTPTPERVDWQRLKAAIRGRVVLPSDPNYAAAKTVFNSRYGTSTPAAVVIPESVDDVRRAMEFAMTDGVKVAPRSGGHSYVGASAADDAMVIDIRGIAGDIVYDADTTLATVPAATGLGPLQRMLAGRGRLIPSGSCPTVGAAGLTLGGGLGADTRRAGLTCDALYSASVALPGGGLVTVSAEDHADLFWALRGGGGGNFGITTSFSFRTYPAVARDVVTMRYPDPAVADVIMGWSQWLAASDRVTWGLVNIPVGPAARGCSVVLASPAGTGAQRAAGLVAAIGTSPLTTDIRTRGRLDFIGYFEGGDDASRPRQFVAGSDIIGELTSGAAQAIVAATKSWPATVGGATAVIESLTGAIRDVAPAATAFPWRREAASIQWYSEPQSPETIGAATAWLASAHLEVKKHSVGGYVNYLEPGVAAERYFGDNLSRLASVRSEYDPQALMGSGLTY